MFLQRFTAEYILRMLPSLRKMQVPNCRTVRLYRGYGLRCVARTDVRHYRGTVRFPFATLVLQDGITFLARNSSGLIGTAISMFSISHSAHAPRYIHIRQFFIHLASSLSISSIAARYRIQTNTMSAMRVGQGLRQQKSDPA